MSFETFRETVITEFLNNWDTSTTPVLLENQAAYIKGTGSIDAVVDNGLTEFVHFFIRENDSIQADLGLTPRVRFLGRVIIQLFVVAGTGEDRIRKLADIAVVILQRKQLVGIQFRTSKLINIGEAGGANEGYYQMNLEVPYQRDLIS